MTKNNTYSLTHGRGIGSERLTILNECYNFFSTNLLKQIKLSGKIVLEIGCGIGIFTCEIAKLVGKSGKVIAVDISTKQLELAQEEAERQNINNIEFIKCSVFEIEKLNIKVDCVYSRFLLMHLNDPIFILNQELNCLKIGGYLICSEPISNRDFYCYPESQIFEKIKKIFLIQYKIYNTDFAIGQKLPHILKSLETLLVYSFIGQAVLSTAREKKQFRLALLEFSEQLIKKNICSIDEIEKNVKMLKKFENENHTIGFTRCMEICVKKTKNCQKHLWEKK